MSNIILFPEPKCVRITTDTPNQPVVDEASILGDFKDVIDDIKAELDSLETEDTEDG